MDPADLDKLTVGDPPGDFFADLAARMAAEYREAADASARAELSSAEELEAERQRAEQRKIEGQAEWCESAEQAGVSGERALIFNRARAKRRRREEAACGVVLQRATRGEFGGASTRTASRPLRRHGARARQSRCAAPGRRRGSRRTAATQARSGDPPEPGPGEGPDHLHDVVIARAVR